MFLCFVFVFLTTFLLELDELACNLGFNQLGTFFKVRPPFFCRFFFGFFWPSGASSSSSSSGWVGLPLPCFFPAFSPCFSGGWEVCFCYLLLCTLASCVSL